MCLIFLYNVNFCQEFFSFIFVFVKSSLFLVSGCSSNIAVLWWCIISRIIHTLWRLIPSSVSSCVIMLVAHRRHTACDEKDNGEDNQCDREPVRNPKVGDSFYSDFTQYVCLWANAIYCLPVKEHCVICGENVIFSCSYF